jgi:hypothetical protein
MNKLFLLGYIFLNYSAIFSQMSYFADHNLTGSAYNLEFREELWDNQIYFYAPQKKRKENGIAKIKITNTSKKGKKTETLQEFNKQGKLTYSFNSFNGYEIKASYLNDSLLTYISRKHSNRKLYESKFIYENNKVKTLERFCNGKKTFSQNYTYSLSNKVLSSVVITQKGTTRKMLHEYNENDQLIKSSFSINNKIKKVWNYDCKPQGELIVTTKEEVTSSKCEFRSENNDGSYSVFVRTITKGIPYLNEHKFTKDSVFYEANYFKKDTILTFNEIVDGNWRTTTNYSKGKITYQYQTKYFENNKNVIEEFKSFKKNKCVSRYKNSFDNNGYLVERKSYNNPKKIKPSLVSKYEVDENGLILKSDFYNKKGFKRNSIFEYTKF